MPYFVLGGLIYSFESLLFNWIGDYFWFVRIHRYQLEIIAPITQMPNFSEIVNNYTYLKYLKNQLSDFIINFQIIQILFIIFSFAWLIKFSKEFINKHVVISFIALNAFFAPIWFMNFQYDNNELIESRLLNQDRYLLLGCISNPKCSDLLRPLLLSPNKHFNKTNISSLSQFNYTEFKSTIKPMLI